MQRVLSWQSTLAAERDAGCTRTAGLWRNGVAVGEVAVPYRGEGIPRLTFMVLLALLKPRRRFSTQADLTYKNLFLTQKSIFGS